MVGAAYHAARAICRDIIAGRTLQIHIKPLKNPVFIV